ncbi:hypothetical protein CN383_25950, partial [Priestia megaterium]
TLGGQSRLNRFLVGFLFYIMDITGRNKYKRHVRKMYIITRIILLSLFLNSVRYLNYIKNQRK